MAAKIDLPINKGEEFTYEVSAKLPGDIDKYRRFIITDTLDAKLEIVSAAVTVDGGSICRC